MSTRSEIQEEAMKAFKWLALGLLLVAFAAVSAPRATAQAPVALEVYDPTGAIEVTQLFAARVPDLNGKTICEVSNDSWEAARTFPTIRELLQRQFPTIKVIPYTEFVKGNIPLESAADIGDTLKKKGCQAAIAGNAG
jgi:hypothetical protein